MKFTRFRIISVGSFVAILVWLVASVGFAFYVAKFGSYNKTYGAIAGVVVGLLWLWITNVALLFGAELDAELERGRELQLGIAAEETLQLPVRDTRGIQKAAARRAEDIAVHAGHPAGREPDRVTRPTGRSAAVDALRSRGPRAAWPGSRPAPRSSRSTSASRSAGHVRDWSSGASRWPARSGRRTPGRRTGAARSPAGARPTPSVLIVGLAPAAHGANRTGRVFTGDRSGDWLFASLHRVGLANQPTSTHLDDGLELFGTRIVAAVRCAPPLNKPTPEERDTCAPWIEREVPLVLPGLRAVVCLGGFGWDAALRSLAAAGVADPATSTPVRSRCRGAAWATSPCSAASTPRSRTPSPAA